MSQEAAAVAAPASSASCPPMSDQPKMFLDYQDPELAELDLAVFMCRDDVDMAWEVERAKQCPLFDKFVKEQAQTLDADEGWQLLVLFSFRLVCGVLNCMFACWPSCLLLLDCVAM